MRSRALGLATLAVAAVFVHCSAASDPPLGGPFGGVASVNPSAGAGSEGGAESSSSGGSTSSSSGSGSSSGSSSSSSSGAACSNTPTATYDASAPVPTFSELYTEYFAVGTPGGCAVTACHAQMDTASDMYTYLAGDMNTQYCGVPNCLASFASSCSSVLAWYGGSMPITGTLTDPQAASDIAAWVAAGSKNN